jgi:hypothetical protein
MPFWVQSLTAFKKNFFGIEDKLSFERAFYVQDRDGKMVRLQNIRFIATLPKQALDMRHDQPTYAFLSPHRCVQTPRRSKGNI